MARSVTASNPSSDALMLAIAVAVGLHAAVIGLVHFDTFNLRPDNVPTSLDVILVDWATEEAPEDPDFLAQVTQRGSGESPDLMRPSEMLPVGDPEPVDEFLPEPDVETTEPADDLLEALEELPELVAVDEPTELMPSPAEAEPEPSLDAAELRRQSMAVARAAPDRLSEARDFPERPRRKFISANTREHLYASYMRSWVAKVERVGNLNYPEQARRMNLEGSLVLSVDILADGSVDQIRVLRSSGFDVLDEAAVRIVRLSSPFSPLPEDITENVDVLTITRTWQFSSRSGLR